MKIIRVEATPFRLPVRRQFRWAGMKAQLGGFVLVRIHTDEGIVGLGEATPLPDWGGDHGRHSGETQRTVKSIVEDVLAPALQGLDPREIARCHSAMAAVLRGNNYARAAVDIALHDLWGKSLGVPLFTLLGGQYRREVPIAHMIGIMPTQEALAEGDAATADGIRTLQIKGGEDAERDIELVRALRERLGSEVVLRLDANQGYQTAKKALDVLRRLEGALDYIEQPVPGHSQMAMVTAQSRTPVIADESCWDPVEALAVVQGNVADAISIYLAKAGGIHPARQVAAIAEAQSLACDVNGSIESGIGNAANLHFALATRPVTIPAVIPLSAPAGSGANSVGGVYYEDDIITAPFSIKGDALQPLTGPGLGVELDEAKLESFRED